MLRADPKKLAHFTDFSRGFLLFFIVTTFPKSHAARGLVSRQATGKEFPWGTWFFFNYSHTYRHSPIYYLVLRLIRKGTSARTTDGPTDRTEQRFTLINYQLVSISIHTILFSTIILAWLYVKYKLYFSAAAALADTWKLKKRSRATERKNCTNKTSGEKSSGSWFVVRGALLCHRRLRRLCRQI